MYGVVVTVDFPRFVRRCLAFITLGVGSPPSLSVEFQPHEKWEPSHRSMEKYFSSRELGSLVALALHLALAFTSRFILAKIKAAPFYMKICWLVTRLWTNVPLLLLGMKRGHFFDTFGRRDGIGIEYLPSTSLECVIDGARPQLLDVSFVGGDQGNTFARGNSALLSSSMSPLHQCWESGQLILPEVGGWKYRRFCNQSGRHCDLWSIASV